MQTQRSSSAPTTVAAFLVIGAFLTAGAAQAADDQAYVDYRQKIMVAVGANMGAIGDILKNQLPFTSHIEDHASALADSAKLMAPAFEHSVVDGATDALPSIWNDWDEFVQAIAKFEQAAQDLEKAAGTGDMAAIGGATKALGKTCGGCHRNFRKKKEDSYKNK